MFRAVAARGNYLGQGRVEMQVGAKEISRVTAKPGEQDWRSAKRLARHLKDNETTVIEYDFQRLPEKVAAWSEADFCRAQAKRKVHFRRRGDFREHL